MSIFVFIGSQENKEEWEKGIVEITDISKLPREQLESLPDGVMIRVNGEGTNPEQGMLYSKEKYAEILEKIDEMFGDIEPAKVGDKQSELETFLEVYQRMTAILYDEYAVSEEGKNDGRLEITCRNLEGGILEGKCVCAGYAEILRNVLAQKGIGAKYISGIDPNKGGGHAWNQVKIGGVWFNVDLTADRNEIVERLKNGEVIGPEYLKTDEQFRNHDVFSENRTKTEEKCDIPIEEVVPNYNVQRSQRVENKETIEQKETEELTSAQVESIGAQVETMLQDNAITRTEFGNQYKQIQDMQREQGLEQEETLATKAQEVGM